MTDQPTDDELNTWCDQLFETPTHQNYRDVLRRFAREQQAVGVNRAVGVLETVALEQCEHDDPIKAVVCKIQRETIVMSAEALLHLATKLREGK